MLLYYRGLAGDGSRTCGSIIAPERGVALRRLRTGGICVTALDGASTIPGIVARIRLTLHRDSGARLAAFRSLAALIEAGVPLRRSLETVTAVRSRESIIDALRAVSSQVESGTALSEALLDHPHEFSRVTIAIVRAGEAGGSLDEALRTIADWEERDRALRRKIVATLTYPAVVSAAAVALLFFLIGNTIPAFAATFTQLHAHLPLITRVLLRLGGVVDSPEFGLSLALVSASVIAAIVCARHRYPLLGNVLDRFRCRLPLIGPVLLKATAARLARTLGSLLKAGVDVVTSIDICTGVVGPAHRACLESVKASLRRGDGLVAPFERSGLFDATFAQLLRSGEESGAIDAMFARIARFYESDVETSLLALTSILEPVLICTLGLAVGTIVASIIIPLYTMIGNIQ
jgi:type IV pilus assembly protein PilC